MSISTQCSHNIPWSGYCKECEIISCKETIRLLEPRVINAKKILEQLENEENVIKNNIQNI